MMSKTISRFIVCAAFIFMFAAVQPMEARAAGAVNDNTIAEAVNSALHLYGYALEVEVNDGRVTLVGNVPTNYDMSVAESRARQVQGVRSVNTFNLGYNDYLGGDGAM